MHLLEIVEKTGKTERTIQRRIEAFNRDNGTDHPTGRYTKITDAALLKYMLEGKPKKAKLTSHNGQPAPSNPKLPSQPEQQPENRSRQEEDQPATKTIFKNGKRVVVQDKPKDETNEITLFTGNKYLDALAAFSLMLCDGVAMGWIAKEAFNQPLVFWPFLVVGLAVGYVAFKAIVIYQGRESDAWAVGFFAAQLMLHLAALSIFGPEWSLIIGKISIAVCIPVASSGLAISQKSIKK